MGKNSICYGKITGFSYITREQPVAAQKSKINLWITVEKCPVCGQRHERLLLELVPMGIPGALRVTHSLLCPVENERWYITVWNADIIRARMEAEVTLAPQQITFLAGSS